MRSGGVIILKLDKGGRRWEGLDGGALVTIYNIVIMFYPSICPLLIFSNTTHYPLTDSFQHTIRI